MARTVSVPADGRAVPRVSKRLLALRGDESLVDQVRRGNEAAFEVIYERHVPGILSFCRHMLGSREEGEDAVQHAFAAAHRDLLRSDREVRLKPWLYAIARNRCLSMLRARREQPKDDLDAATAGLDDEVQRRADLRELVADLQDLPEDQRAALVLSELRDFSHADVAEALGCEVANVKGLVFRARSGLIERREARGAACDEIQQELATVRGGSLRRGRLRHHLRACPACSGYLEQVRAQRKMMALILPVAPTLGLKEGVLAAVGIGTGASGGGGAAAGGVLAGVLSPAGATVAKVAVVGALVGGGGVAGKEAIDGTTPPPGPPPAVTPAGPAGASPLRPDSLRPDSPRTAERRSSPRRRRADDRRRADRKRRAHARGRFRGRGRGTRREKRALHPPGRAKPKRLRGFERRPRGGPLGRPRGRPRPLRPEPVRPLRPLREPREKGILRPGERRLLEPVPTLPRDRVRRVR